MALLMGYLMRRVAFFEVTTAQAINRFAFYVATPALMFNLVSQVPLHQIDWPTVRIYLFSELLVYGGVAVICMRIFKLPAAESVLVLLDSNHSQAHVAAELEAYGPLVSPGSYIVACDGIMHQVAGAPRTEPDWSWNNPISAVQAYLTNHQEFEAHEPEWPFNEGLVRQRVSYWTQAYLRRRQ